MKSSLFDKWRVGNGDNKHSMSVHCLTGISEETTTQNAFSDFAETYKVTDRSLYNNLKTLKSFAISLDVWKDFKESISSEEVDIDEIYDTMIEKYPMISLLGYTSEENHKTIANYIDGMEN
jgi:hypothetical protein